MYVAGVIVWCVLWKQWNITGSWGSSAQQQAGMPTLAGLTPERDGLDQCLAMYPPPIYYGQSVGCLPVSRREKYTHELLVSSYSERRRL